jgi:hypothetical protein
MYAAVPLKEAASVRPLRKPPNLLKWKVLSATARPGGRARTRRPPHLGPLGTTTLTPSAEVGTS